MARSDLLVSLVRAGASGDREMLRSTAEALVADERAKKHYIVADRIQRALSAVPVTPPALTASSPHLAAANGREAILEVTARLQLDDLLLPLPARESGRQLIEEQAGLAIGDDGDETLTVRQCCTHHAGLPAIHLAHRIVEMGEGPCTGG